MRRANIPMVNSQKDRKGEAFNRDEKQLRNNDKGFTRFKKTNEEQLYERAYEVPTRLKKGNLILRDVKFKNIKFNEKNVKI